MRRKLAPLRAVQTVAGCLLPSDPYKVGRNHHVPNCLQFQLRWESQSHSLTFHSFWSVHWGLRTAGWEQKNHVPLLPALFHIHSTTLGSKKQHSVALFCFHQHHSQMTICGLILHILQLWECWGCELQSHTYALSVSQEDPPQLLEAACSKNLLPLV